MKLTEWEREDYKALKKQLKPFFIQDRAEGVTVAIYRREGQNFSRVATAYCGRTDKFNKKRGKYTALVRVAQMESLVVPNHRLDFVLEGILG